MSSTLKNPKLVVILGSTASGKSDLAVKIAKKFNGEIISADSRQVYKGLDIGSGKIAKKEMRGIPHYLLSVASPKRTFTAAQFQKLGRAAIQEILKKGRIPIIVGGTGFYIDALLAHDPLPAVPPYRTLRKKLEGQLTEELFAELQRRDPHRAGVIDRHNRRRLVRALEILAATGRPIPRTMPQKSTSDFSVLKLGILLPDAELKARIHERLLARMRRGMIAEVRGLHKRGVSWKRLDDLGLEYRFVSRYLRGEINPSPAFRVNPLLGARVRLRTSKKTTLEILEREIWRYAKRQYTYFKKDKDIRWIAHERDAERLVRNFFKRAEE